MSGVGVPQEDGRVFLGFTSINENGRGLHTRALINTSDFSGFWSDNAGNTSQPFVFDPGVTCPGGPRTGPTNPYRPEDATGDGVAAESSALRARLAALETSKK